MILQKQCSYRFVFNDPFLCVVGKSINIYGKDFSLICSFSDMRDYSSAAFVEKDVLVAKNTSGVFKIYDLLNGICIKTIQVKERLRYAQDAKFVISADNKYIFTVLLIKGENQAFFKIAMDTGEYRYVPLSVNGAICDIAEDGAFVSILHTLLSNTYVTCIEPNEMVIDRMYTIPELNNRDNAVMFFDKQHILSRNMSLKDIRSGKITEKLPLPYGGRMESGYFSRVQFSSDKKYIFFIFSEKITVYNLTEKTVEKEYKFKYCSCAQDLPGNKIAIGTWERVYIFDLAAEA